MSFAVGDRVKILSLKDNGTIIEADPKTDNYTVEPDDQKKYLARFSPKEKIQYKEMMDVAEHASMRYFTFESDLELLNKSKPEADWKDIWSQNE